MPRNVPTISGRTVSSGSATEAGMNGRNAAAWGSSGSGPTMSGYSCGGTSEIAMAGPFLAESLGPYPSTPLAGPDSKAVGQQELDHPFRRSGAPGSLVI